MRICILSFMFPPIVGGSEMQALKQAQELQARGHEVFVVTLRHNKTWPAEEIVEGVKTIRVAGGLFRRDGSLRIGPQAIVPVNMTMLAKLWSLRNQFDVIHSMQISCISTMATLVCRLMHKPILISVQSAGPTDEQIEQMNAHNYLQLMTDTLPSDTEYLRGDKGENSLGDVEGLYAVIMGGKLLARYLRKSEAYYQVLSNRSRTYLLDRGFKAEKIIRIPNGIDPERFKPAPQRPDASKSGRDIVSVARMEYPKGIDVVLHAWARMMKEPADWRANLKPRLRLAGHGFFQPQMERLAQELGISDSVEFLGLHRDVPGLLQQAWGFVIPSRWEGMPNALVEAMASGLPCVATRVSGSEDLINDGVNGLLVPTEDPAAMAKALRRIIEESKLAQSMAEQARATIMREYQLSTVVETCLKTYKEIQEPPRQALPLALEKRGQ